MSLLLRIGLRNLLRQKRRNLLLGSAISVGMAILLVANAFSRGISDVLFNRVLAFVTGSISVNFSQGGNRMRQVFRDGERMQAIVKRTLPAMSGSGEAIGIFARAIGRGRTDNAIMVGMDVKAEGTKQELATLEENFRMVSGHFKDLLRKDMENPVLLAEQKAKSLNVGLGDVVRVRYQDVDGQNRAARLTVAGIFRPANVFMATPVFLDLNDLKRLAGYGPNDIGLLHIMVPDPKRNAVKSADALHAALAPPLAAAFGSLESGGRSVLAVALGFRVDSASLAGLGKALPPLLVPESSAGRATEAKDVLAGKELADALSLKGGSRCSLAYASRQGDTVRVALTLTGVLPAASGLPGNALLINDRDFYAFYYDRWPRSPATAEAAGLPDSGHALNPFLAREWILLDRTRTTEELQRKYRLLPRLKTRAFVVDVQTMYESASMIVNLEYALNLITLGAVLILFFIIQVGVVNTLRMTIRERTREIGTVRAIGMQKQDVRNLFLLETFFLTLSACAAGVALAFATMEILRRIPMDLGNNPFGMLLVNGRLHFLPSLAGATVYLLLILAIALATAWFPARRAANLSAAEALRHFG